MGCPESKVLPLRGHGPDGDTLSPVATNGDVSTGHHEQRHRPRKQLGLLWGTCLHEVNKQHFHVGGAAVLTRVYSGFTLGHLNIQRLQPIVQNIFLGRN